MESIREAPDERCGGVLMDARTVWEVWRRILREVPLQRALFSGSATDLASRFGLSAAEEEIARAYAGNSVGATWFVTTYRFRLTNSFFNALETGAPLTLRALLANRFDLKMLGERFLDEVGWRDYGPHVYTYCRDALAFLGRQPDIAGIPGIQDLMGLEGAAVEMFRGLAAQAAAPGAQNGLLWRTPSARLYRAPRRISEWLRDKTLVGRHHATPGRESILVYLPDSDSTHRFVAISDRAADIYDALIQPARRDELSARLASSGLPPLAAGDEAVFDALARYRAIAAG
jgi:hypothetical protein